MSMFFYRDTFSECVNDVLAELFVVVNMTVLNM